MSKSQITIAAIGTRGDVEPFVALAQQFQSAGLGVRLAIPRNFLPLVEGRGLSCLPLRLDVQSLLQSDEGLGLLGAGGSHIVLLRRIAKVAGSLARDLLDDLERSCHGSDAVFYSPLACPIAMAARTRGIPAWLGCLQPFTETSAFPSPVGPQWLGRFGPLANRGSHRFVDALFQQSVNGFIQALQSRDEAPDWLQKSNHPPLPFHGAEPIFYGISARILPPQLAWPESAHLTGYWFLESRPGMTVPRNLHEFLEAGPPPICIGFGSMTGDRSRHLIERSLKAVRRLGKRALILSGWSQSGSPLPADGEDVLTIEEISHHWLFPRVAAVLHHGGAGTTAAALRAGVPSMVIPFFFDQQFWGNRIESLNTGFTFPVRSLPSVEDLAARLQQIDRSRLIQESTRRFASVLADEHGSQTCVTRIQALLARPEPALEHALS